MDALDVAALLVLAFMIFVMCPYGIYLLIQFRRFATQSTVDPIIAHRNAFIIYTVNILVLVTNATERVYMVSAKIWNIINVPLWSIDLFFSTWWAAGTLFAIKCYHLYYQQRYNMAVADASWRLDLNPNYTNWYIANKHTYGNPVYLLKIASLPFFIFTTLNVLVATMSTGIRYHLIKVTIAAIPLTVAACILFKARKLNDIYKIRNEIFYQLMLVASFAIFYVVSFVVGLYVPDPPDQPGLAERIEWFSYLFASIGGTLSYAFFCTYYPLRLIRAKGDEAALLAHQNRSTPHIDTVTLLMTISSYDTFLAFMNHLVREFAAESLLFLVELTQIKHHYQQQHNGINRVLKDSHAMIRNLPALVPNETEDERETDERHARAANADFNNANSLPSASESASEQPQSQDDLCVVIDFNFKPCKSVKDGTAIFTYLFGPGGFITTPIIIPAALPETLAITSGDYPTLFERMRFLYNKYVKAGSEHEINISFTMRESLVYYFENAREEKDWKVFNIFDDAVTEMLMLLHGAFLRFQTSDVYSCVPANMENRKNVFDEMELPVIRNKASLSNVIP